MLKPLANERKIFLIRKILSEVLTKRFAFNIFLDFKIVLLICNYP